MAPRGRGGKFSKPSRGGGKHFSRDVQPVDKDGNPVGLWREPGDDIPSSGEEDKSEEPSGSEDESSDEDNAQAGPSSGAGSSAGPAMTREERRAAAKAKKLAAIARRNKVAAQPGDLPPSDSEEDESDDGDDEDLPANPNHTAKSRSQLHKDPAAGDEKAKAPGGDLSQLSRREREAIQAQQARERYMKLHAEGKTEEARADLARLALIREQREAERLRKEAEKEEKAALAREKAAAREQQLKRLETKGKKKGGPKKGGPKK